MKFNRDKFIEPTFDSLFANGHKTTYIEDCDNKGCAFNIEGKCAANNDECFGYFVTNKGDRR